jgi:hypothetical protein
VSVNDKTIAAGAPDAGAVVIGTAGWSIPRRSAEQFPGEGTHLQRYARFFGGTEINSSFHRPHARAVYQKWAAATPDGFRFAVKLTRELTHDARLMRPADLRQRAPSKGAKWVYDWGRSQDRWRDLSLKLLRRRTVRCMLVVDISGFYENIDLSTLKSDLNGLNLDVPAIDLLSKCLYRWAQPRNRGIPQGYTASDLLAKVYMHSVDLALQNSNVKFLRYNDDLRIFCKSRLEAKQVLVQITELLRQRGLNLQTAKTAILDSPEAMKIIEGVAPLIHQIQVELPKDLQTVPSGPEARGRRMQPATARSRQATSTARETLERAFLEHFQESGREFSSRILHYLLRRLAAVGSTIAIDYSLALLRERPEETDFILRYLNAVTVPDYVPTKILAYAASADAIYDFQLYQIVRWFNQRKHYPKRLIQLARQWAHDANRSQWLRCQCLNILGAGGDASDWARIEGAYGDARNELDRADIIGALARVERGRRNAFFARIKNDGELIARAIERVKSEDGARTPPSKASPGSSRRRGRRRS